MHLLELDTTLSLLAGEKVSFTETVTELYITEMTTIAGHVTVTIRE